MPAARLSKDKRALILAALCEGSAINSVCRMFKVGKHTVLRVIQEVGEAAQAWHDEHFRGLTIQRIAVDEQWAYVHTHKERMDKKTKRENPGRGDCWLWASIDPESKAIINWLTGKRTASDAKAFAYDLAERVDGRVQITSDKLIGYTFAIPQAFGGRANYAQEEKVFQSSKVPAHQWPKYRVDPLVGVKRQAVYGKPDLKTATVCHIERFFLTVRQSNKRCTRKTLAYSKVWNNHALTSSMFIFIYNMCRKHETTKLTPAMKLGITDHRWTLEEVVEMTDLYLDRKAQEEFDRTFSGTFVVKPRAKVTYEPVEPKTPWYLDPTSGGPNPDIRKEGIAYEGDLQ